MFIAFIYKLSLFAFSYYVIYINYVVVWMGMIYEYPTMENDS